MNVQDALRELDGLFQRNEVSKVEPFLLGQLAVAEAEGDRSSVLTLLNELMGFYRGMSRFKDALAIGDRALELMTMMGYKGSVPYATTLLNVATAYRADGQTARAIGMFEEVGRIYTAQQVGEVYLVASLHNNLSLAYQEAGNHDKAIECSNLALPLIQSLPNSANEVAVTLTNLALSQIKCSRLMEAKAHLLRAVSLFESQPSLNPHYGGALAGLGEIAYKERNPQESIAYYERALEAIGAHYGKNMYYAVTLASLAVVYEDVDKAKSDAMQQEAQAIQDSFK